MEGKTPLVWVHCPICRNETRVKVTYDTILINFPLFCPKCKREQLVDIVHLKMMVHDEPLKKQY